MQDLTECPVCGGRDTQALTSAIGPRAYCLDCHHGWRTDRPVYAYDQTAMCPLGTASDRLQSQIDMFCGFAPQSAAILEIGCATGELAKATRARLSPRVYDAIELSPAGEIARQHLDNLYARPLGELLAASEITGPYDVILMSHVLEHLESPAGELSTMRQVLADQGIIFLEVPNRGGHRRLPIDDNQSHLHFFSTSSLTRLLTRHGLETLEAATDARLDSRYADSIRVVCRPFKTPQWSASLLSDHPALNGATDIVVWGAGSLVSELLANYFDVSRIDYFIDRNPAKHGLEILGRPTRAPTALGFAPRTILINSIDFADAIEADIRALYPAVEHRLVRIGDLLG